MTWGVNKSFVIFCVMFERIRSFFWRLRAFHRLQLDHSRRIVYLGGNAIILQEMAWKVLIRLRSSAPGTVSRSELIEEIWGNRWSTGEKGLNQAIWQIRAALRDEARSPRFVQTIPRSGYRWLQPLPRDRSSNANRRRWERALYVLPFLLLPVSVMFPANPGPGNYDVGQHFNEDRTAVAAYLDPSRRIVVDLEGGCRGLIVPSQGKSFGEPAISADGGAVAFTVTELDSCKTVTVQLSDYTRQEFENCPVHTEI